MDSEIGSLKVGKLVDFIVIDGNLLDDICQLEKVQYMMVNGCLYDVVIMNEVGNYNCFCFKFYFEQDGSGNVWFMMIINGLVMFIQCVC